MLARERTSLRSILRLGWVLILAGCGSGAPITSPVTSNANNLAGNWLLSGTLPKAVGSSANQPGFGASFDVIGSNVVATAAISTVCTNSSATFGLRLGAAVIGTIASDGSFSVASPTGNTFPTLTLKGNVPVMAGGAWSGTYTLVSNSPLCPVNEAGSFTATRVQDLSGTYVGTGSFSTFQSTTPIALSLTLSQGAPLYSPIAPAPISSRLGLAGSIQIQGISCFSKGTSSTVTSSEVEGGPFLVNFTMDDGSTLMLLGSIDDIAASSLDVDVLEVTGGACSGIYSFGLNALVAKH